MKCPKCKKEIDSVWLESRCWQKADLEGNKIVDYQPIDTIDDTLSIRCPECDKDITKYVKET